MNATNIRERIADARSESSKIDDKVHQLDRKGVVYVAELGQVATEAGMPRSEWNRYASEINGSVSTALRAILKAAR
jgi:hypothetical protein